MTGHDSDLHCRSGEQCHYVQVAVDYVRAGAPAPTRPMLVLDKGDLDFPAALTNAGISRGAYVVMDPLSSAFATESLTTDKYSAILIASDASCGGCDLNATPSGGSQTPDSDAINARRGDITRFFNAGGGIFANSGALHGDGNPSTGPDTYYGFLPLPIGGQPVAPPFCLTSVGASLGLEDPATLSTGCPDPTRRRGTRDDINCCATHNSFSDPAAGSALRVAERDLGTDGRLSRDDRPETIVAEGVARGGGIVAPPVAGKSFNAAPAGGRVYFKCRGGKRRRLTAAVSLPIGCLIDARDGKLRLVSAANRTSTRTQSALFYQGQFKVRQKRSSRPVTELRLAGKLARCVRRSAAGGPVRDARRRKRRRGRRLWGRGRGRYRTRGRRSSATVRGTTWLVYDRCDGSTLTKVRRGKVTVRDFVRRKRIRLKKGQSYVARPRKRRG